MEKDTLLPCLCREILGTEGHVLKDGCKETSPGRVFVHSRLDERPPRPPTHRQERLQARHIHGRL